VPAGAGLQAWVH